MTENQRKFADEYLIDCNASRAYKVAYPYTKNDSVARANASRLLTKANVKAYIQKHLDEISATKVATAEEVMEYLTSVLRGESRTEMIVGCGADESSDVCRVQKSPDEKERLKAAELLGKRYALFTDRNTDSLSEIKVTLIRRENANNE